MSAQNGKDLLIKMDIDGNGTFETLAGLRASRISFNAQNIDTTSMESEGQWRELLAGGGVRSASLTGSGVFRDGATDAKAREVFFSGELPDFEVIIPDFGSITGAFQISSIDYSGQYDGEATYEMSLSSAGAISFAAA